MTSHLDSSTHPHVHGEGCGHLAIEHADHLDYLHDGHLHHQEDGKIDCHVIDVDRNNPAECTPEHACPAHDGSHVHGPTCGHPQIPHGDHVDFLVAGHLHHPHGQHCDNHGEVAALE